MCESSFASNLYTYYVDPTFRPQDINNTKNKTTNELIKKFLNEHNINIIMYLFDSDKLYFANRNNDIFYDILIKKYQNSFSYDIICIRNIVRHDDSIVPNLNSFVNCSSTDLYSEIKKINIIPNDELNSFVEFIKNIF